MFDPNDDGLDDAEIIDDEDDMDLIQQNKASHELRKLQRPSESKQKKAVAELGNMTEYELRE